MTSPTPRQTPKPVNNFGNNSVETKQQLLDAIGELKAILKDSLDALN